MNNNRLVKISKYLSYCLRHHPDELGLKLAPGGWVAINELLEACAKSNPITRTELEEVVAKSDKKRFSLDTTGMLIRANQGHSVEVDLQLEAVSPPNMLYHGTGKQNVDSILKTGLRKMSRHHVHLSADIETARKVGMRQGYPVVLRVDGLAMSEAGYQFYCSENGVWLVDSVPSEYLQPIITL